MLSWTSLEEAFPVYKEVIAKERSGPYGHQWPGKDWRTRCKPLSDPAIQAHLAGTYWVATKAPWYPRLSFLDFDHPDPEAVARAVDTLGLSPGQYLLCTSPSWWETGNFHMMLAIRFNDAPATKRLILDLLKKPVHDIGAELYPQLNRKFRLSFGKDQRLIDEETGAPLEMHWSEMLSWALKIEPYPLEERPRQLELEFREPRPEPWIRKAEAEALLEEGLPGPSTRHNACLTLAIYYYRQNLDTSDARRKLKHWIKTSHHGYSKMINRGDWRGVKEEIDRVVGWTYARYGRGKIWPDSTHNMEGWIAAKDMQFLAEVFPRDIVNQRRLLKLIAYYRPRSYHDWVFIPRWRWFGIARKETYKTFQAALENKGLLNVNDSYRVSGYSKSFQLKLPYASLSERLTEDDRAIQEYDQAVFQVYGSVRDVRDAMKLPRITAYKLAEKSV